MNQIIKYLHQPYPCPARTWKTIAIISLLVFTILFIFKPFGISMITSEWRFWIILGYGVVTAMAVSVQIYLSPLLFPRYYDENRWTVGRNIFSTTITLILVALGNIAYGYVFGITWQHLNISVFLSALFITVAVGIFPIVLITILRQNRLLSISLREAGRINDSLGRGRHNPNSSQMQQNESVITLSGTGKGDLLEMPASQLLFIEACGNYIKVNYLKNNMTAQKMLRATIKQIEDGIIDYPSIVKCHRAFLVNLSAIRQISGNSQGYRLTLNGTEDEVPVSRAFTSTIKTKIGQLSS